MVRAAGGSRVQIFDIENDEGRPIYVHAKVCIVDDVWAVVGSNNLNNRSWTHDSELAAAIIDDERDPRAPDDPGGLGDGARKFARRLRVDLMREHLALEADDDLLDPARAAATVRARATALDTLACRRMSGATTTREAAPARVRTRSNATAGTPPVVDHPRVPDRARSGRAAAGNAAAPRLLTPVTGRTREHPTAAAVRARPVRRDRGRGGLFRHPDVRGRGGLTAACSATMPPVRLRQRTCDHPASSMRCARPTWSGQARIDSAR